jgi:cytidine deaminase
VKYKKLILAAIKAKENSYSPYSKLSVGAAILTKSGKIFTGCNIENSSFSLTICAERTAIFKAISEGSKKFSAIAIVSDLDDPIPPCGACRQVLFDLAGNIDVILLSKSGKKAVIKKLSSFLPMPFTDNYIKKV